jgi:hypothetical protein
LIFVFELGDLIFLNFNELEARTAALFFFLDELGRAGVNGDETTASKSFEL